MYKNVEDWTPEELADPSHHRDEDSPCQGCGAYWSQPRLVITHRPGCTFLKALFREVAEKEEAEARG